MSDFLYYILQVSIVFAILYLLYRVCFSKLTFHALNRALLLIMLPLSLLMPFLNIEISPDYLNADTQLPMLFDEIGYVGEGVSQLIVEGNVYLSLAVLTLLVYAIGLMLHLIRLSLNVVRLVKMRQASSSVSYDGFRYIKTNSPFIFSCFKWIFIPNNQMVDDSIIAHEKLHAKSLHTIDLCVTELFIALLWFNPFVYFFRKDLKLMHEYQVDSKLLHQDIKKSDYLQLLLNSLVNTHKSLGLCNYFQGLTIQKRVNMITKEKSTNWKLLRYILIVPVVTLVSMSFSASVNTGDDIPSISPIKVGNYDKISLEFGKINSHNKSHKGIDFSAKTGTEILATANGVVAKSEFHKNGYGNRVIINHGNGYVTHYAHMNEYTVKVGDAVKRGDVIGFVGSTGYSTGPHLHYEVHSNGELVNPKDYIKD